jgi:hypothetical protein
MKKGTDILMENPERCDHPLQYLNGESAVIYGDYPKTIVYMIVHCEKCGGKVKLRMTP